MEKHLDPDYRRRKGNTRTVRFYTDAEKLIMEYAKSDRRKFSNALDIIVDEGLKALEEKGVTVKKKLPRPQFRLERRAHSRKRKAA